MSFQDAVNSDVRFTPLEITQLQHEPNHMPRMKFKALCRNHEVFTLTNAEYLVQLWNFGQEVPDQDYLNEFGTDVCGHIAWLLEEDVGPETFWLMQAAPPIQPEQALITLWEVAQARRAALLKERITEYYSNDDSPAPPLGVLSPAHR